MPDFDSTVMGMQIGAGLPEFVFLRGRAAARFGAVPALFSVDLEALFGLPFLIWEFTGGSIEKAVVVSCGLLLLVQRIVGDGPKEES